MITITQEQAKAIRRKQADLSLNIEQTAKAIGITYITYKRIIKGDYSTKQSVYDKVMRWFMAGY